MTSKFFTLILSATLFPAAGPAFARDLEIHTIDVGQGASELVIGPNGTTILIDGGLYGMGYSEVLPYLNTIFPPGSRRLDYIIASHDDSDHYGGLNVILDNGYTAGTIYHCGDNAGFGKGIQIPLGLEINLGGGAKATCVGRYGQFTDGSYGNTSDNNKSVCLLIEYGVFDYITAGDLEDNENQLSNTLITYPPGSPYLDPAYGVDVIHVNHHGGRHSSLTEYVNRLKHQLAVINGGMVSQEAVDRLKGRAYGVTWTGCSNVYRTTYSTDYIRDPAPEWDCPTLGDMVVTYDGYSPYFYLEGTIKDPTMKAYPVDEPVSPPRTPTPTLTPTPTPSTPTPTPSSFPTPDYLVLEDGDYDGDGTDDIAIYRNGIGLWAVKGITRLHFGSSNDLPVPADYDGDGTTDIAVFKAASGLWAIRGLTRLYFGLSYVGVRPLSPPAYPSGSDPYTADLPVPADYDGDGSTEIAIFRESSGLWTVRGVTRLFFGAGGDVPVPGDYNGDGKADPGIFRERNGLWAVKLPTRTLRIYFGGPGDRPVAGDYAGNGIRVPAVFREGSGLWAIRNLTRCYFGNSSDRPVPADYNGDGADDLGVFRSASGLWAVRAVTRTHYGSAGDLPVTR